MARDRRLSPPTSRPGISSSLAGAACWVVTDGKMGDVAQCLGVAERLGLMVEQRTVGPRPPWSWLAPRGPGDPRERPGVPGGPLAGPFPDVAIASGRRAVPALRAVKRASGSRTFTVFLKDPRIGVAVADLIWVPEHDGLRGANVVVTLTAPHGITPERLALARASRDPRLAGLPAPRVGMILGGPSRRQRFLAADVARLLETAQQVLRMGHSLMVVPSRRTPPALTAMLRGLANGGFLPRVFVWDGSGANPYVPVLASADALIVTGDSHNMLGEAAATGTPLHVVEPDARTPRMTRFIDGLVEAGVARRWAGTLDPFPCVPIDATPILAAAIAAGFDAARARRQG